MGRAEFRANCRTGRNIAEHCPSVVHGRAHEPERKVGSAMSEQTHDPELAGFERTLKSLSPAPAAMDRDVLMFQAGRASARRNGWRWPVATAVLASTAIVFALLWQQRPAVVIVDRPVPQIVERIV